MTRRLPNCLGVLLPIAASCLAISFLHGQNETETSFIVGDKIQSDRHLNVRTSPAGEKLGFQVDGRFGKIVDGPKLAAINSTTYTWWNVVWEIGVDGWCATIGIEPVAIDLDHGNTQVAAMLRDRPEMASFVDGQGNRKAITKDDPIWKWVAQRFGTRVNNHKIYWDNSDVKKPDHYEADHTIPWKNQPAQIRLRSKIRKSANEQWENQSLGKMWSSVVFELMNVTNAGGFLRLWDQAKQGRLSRTDYVEGNQVLEYHACIALKDFYHSRFEPWAELSGYIPNDDSRGDGFYLWIPGSYEAWISSYTDGSYNYFYTYFDDTIVPYLKKKGRFDPERHSPAKPIQAGR